MTPRKLTADAPDLGKGGGLLAELRGSANSPDAAPGTEAVMSSRPRRRISTQSLVLALVLAASAASLYTMRKQGLSAGISFAPVKLDAPDGLRPEDARQQQRIMAELARSVLPTDFHDQPLLKNPFKMPATSTAAQSAAMVPADTSAQDRARRDEETRNRLAQLTLAGVMQGPVPLARVNGKTIRAGDTLDDLFTVTAINERSVDLMADGRTYTIQMSDTAAPTNGPRRGSPGSLTPPLPAGPRR